jgi:phosphate acetyltransferase
VKYIVQDSLLITPGDREDIIATALGCFREDEGSRLKVAGLVLSGGIVPDKAVMDQLEGAKIPVLLSEDDTYDVASTIHDLTVKIRPCDTAKVKEVIKLIHDDVDLDAILKGM